MSRSETVFKEITSDLNMRRRAAKPMKPHKQTTSAVSSIAGKYVRMTNAKMVELLSAEKTGLQFFRDIRKLAASCLAQDQVKGQGKP